MLKSYLSYFLMAMAIIITIDSANAAHIQFEQSKMYAEVSAKAKSEEKNFFVYFSASWCGPCQIMNQTAFKDENLANFIDDNIIPVKADIDELVGKLWQDEFGVTSIPTIIFFDKDGLEIQRVTSGVSGSKLLAILAALDNDHRPDNVIYPPATLINHRPLQASTPTKTSFKSTHSSDVIINAAPSKNKVFELELGNYRAESDYQFQMNALSARYEQHRFYIIERTIPSGKIIYQLILGGFKNEADARQEATYLQSRNYDPHLVKL